MQNQLRSLLQDNAFSAIHDVTIEHANRRTREGCSLAWLEARAGNAYALEKILTLTLGVDLKCPIDIGTTPAMIAAENGRSEALFVLLNTRTPEGTLAVSAHYRRKQDGASVLSLSAQAGFVEVLHVIAKAPIDGDVPLNLDELTLDGQPAVNLNLSRPEDGSTPAIMAAENGHSSVLRALIKARDPDGKASVDFNQADLNGITPLLTLVAFRHVDALRMLINARTENGEMLVNLNQTDKQGNSPALYAANNADASLLRVLIEASRIDGHVTVDLNKANLNGETPAYIATLGGHADALRVLMDIKTPNGQPVINLQQTYKKGTSLALVAARGAQLETLRILAAARTPEGQIAVDLNLADRDGITPILYAAFQGQYATVKLLMESRVDITCQYKGLTPLNIAEKKGYHDIAALLQTPLTDEDDKYYTPVSF